MDGGTDAPGSATASRESREILLRTRHHIFMFLPQLKYGGLRREHFHVLARTSRHNPYFPCSRHSPVLEATIGLVMSRLRARHVPFEGASCPRHVPFDSASCPILGRIMSPLRARHVSLTRDDRTRHTRPGGREGLDRTAGPGRGRQGRGGRPSPGRWKGPAPAGAGRRAGLLRPQVPRANVGVRRRADRWLGVSATDREFGSSEGDPAWWYNSHGYSDASRWYNNTRHGGIITTIINRHNNHGYSDASPALLVIEERRRTSNSPAPRARSIILHAQARYDEVWAALAARRRLPVFRRSEQVSAIPANLSAGLTPNAEHCEIASTGR